MNYVCYAEFLNLGMYVFDFYIRTWSENNLSEEIQLNVELNIHLRHKETQMCVESACLLNMRKRRGLTFMCLFTWMQKLRAMWQNCVHKVLFFLIYSLDYFPRSLFFFSLDSLRNHTHTVLFVLGLGSQFPIISNNWTTFWDLIKLTSTRLQLV